MSDSCYDRLCALDREVAPLGQAMAVMGWDQEVNLPPKGLAARASALAALAGESHRRLSAPEVGEWLAGAEAEGANDEVAAANLRLWREGYDRRTKLPQSFVEEKSKVSSEAKMAWAGARKASDFALFAPLLEKQVELARRQSDYLGYDDHPYDALINLYERGMTTAKLRSLFGSFRAELAEIAAEAVERTKANPSREFTGSFPVEAQQQFNREVAESIGFDFEAGRIDTTTHPFCSGNAPGDTRLTTRYYDHDFSASCFGVLHEAGHGLYDQGLPAEHYPHPAYESVSLGIHESQSRMWENHVGRGLAFWQRWTQRAGELFPQLAGWTPEEMVAAVNRANFSFIRVDADEATYDLHIALRFEIEQALVSGELEVKDVPAAWNSAFKQSFGLEVPDDSKGCLQDIHWAMGGIGYFPTYTLGNLASAQLMEAAMQDESVASGYHAGDTLPLLAWMRERVHRHGSILTPDEIIQKATGKELSPDAFLGHLRTRFLG
ncbi:carboxypeptidase M32 [Sulfuriroseicoccus oceanibius]|uniref:Metal-dependent carboxypeptidase n=1 Tax=Sulfuriroseicoccus oceanibius TaxID=2707525 RepID=A0A6B3LCJ9_9BACT|nr:carboxypeptidase M32 [Sulfuriroseicoccus oceanibius]QQL45234.1 carboxypeptidase M32 [Sulfuriroseicoccus oceanibius]